MLKILDKEYAQNSAAIGLSTEEAERRLKAFGPNEISEGKKNSAAKIFAGQFKDIMVIILLIATVISVFLGEIYDAVTIILIVLINAVLGFIQEYRTERTLEELSKMTAPVARCYRDGKLSVIPAAQVVKGDIIELEAGDRVPADAAIIHCKGFFANEAILTGEAVPVEKNPCLSSGEEIDRPGRSDLVYSGTIITKGNARARVIATGKESQMGKISGMLSEIERELTPLQKRLGELGKVIAVICLVVCAVVFVAGVLRGEDVFQMLLTGISIAIAAIPEGLPATVTIALALAVRRMLAQNALVHRLNSVETLGCASVICSDKTGTITENKMTVTKIYAGFKEYDVLGSGHKISGEIRLAGVRINPLQSPSLEEILVSAVLCENASISSPSEIFARDRGRLDAPGEWAVMGDPTETALLIAAAKAGFMAKGLKYDFKRLDEIPFDSETRCMTVLVLSKTGERIAFSKGALDVIISKCGYVQTDAGVVPMTFRAKKEILEKCDELSDSALRVIAFAKKNISGDVDFDRGMVFLGLMGMIDPPRPEAKRAIKICSKAHIKTVMITGDHKNTAVAVARQAGILKGDAEGKVMTGEELSKLSDSELEACIENIRVFARVSPSDKLKIVRAFKKRGNVVAMTGDGVNDAPAVKEASIGVSMGITGTDVTKQASDIILLDDNFATLVSAVEQGRTIYSNIRKFVRYLLSCNIGEVLTMFGGILMGMPLVLLPTQILLVNLVTDGLPAIALGAEPVEKSIMEKKPRSPNENFFSDGLMTKIIFRGIMIGLCTLGSFVALLNLGGNLSCARTGALLTLVLSQLIHVFECKSEEKNIFTVPYFNNFKLILAVAASLFALISAIYFPPLQLVFSTVALNRTQFLAALAFSIAVPILNSIFSIFTFKKLKVKN
jgi:Ca2+-transporting ATPase